MSELPVPDGAASNWSAPTYEDVPDDRTAEIYEPPTVIDIGRIRDLTGGSSGSGRADANSQYYW